jgi:NAD(P)-dependent dehydrogenase (short-subunit alcohol dehydrogenase family)
MRIDLQNQVVLMSGASGGLGEGVVQAFLDAGAKVAGVARKWTADATSRPGFLPIVADLTQEQGCADAVKAVLARWSRLDAAVHLMGGFAGGTAVQATSVETWDQMMSVNLRSAFLFFRAALPPLLAAGRGRLLAVGSRPGFEPAAGLAAYSVSKAGLHALVKALAAENKDTGVTCNAVAPSTIETAANRAAMPQADASTWVRPAAIGELLVYLASDAARDINGALIPIYGRA